MIVELYIHIYILITKNEQVMDQSINADVLESLLAEAGKYHPHYGDRLAMHLHDSYRPR